MSRRAIIPWIILPAVVVALYFLTWWLATPFFLKAVASEQGLVELGTAGLFFAAAVLASHLAIVTKDSLASIYRAMYGIFAFAAVFVALEEISYGQHLFGWESPEYFRERNLQGEVNLHNMLGSKPSKRMHLVANVGTLIGFGALPGLLWLVRRRDSAPFAASAAYAPGTWTYHLVPGLELLGIILLAQLVAWLKKIPGAGVDHNELRELLWAWAAFGYIVVMRRRLLGASRES